MKQSWNFQPARHLYSKNKIWGRNYDKQTRLDLEKYWCKRLMDRWNRRNSPPKNHETREKFYCLSMFPYPSGDLHMGHVRVYTISDTMAIYHRLNGKQVLHPMGWDSFGLPAENAARINHIDPSEWTEKNIASMKKQLEDLNLFFDWDREISTCQPEYYRWTQYIFLKLFENGLAYKKKAAVNWDPVDETVLADEQVDENGRSWRSGAVVQKKWLKQWYLGTTQYTQSLLQTIDELEETVGVKSIQRHWLGEANGYFINFNLEVNGTLIDFPISVFCTSPCHLPLASHVNLHTDHLTEFFESLSREVLSGAVIGQQYQYSNRKLIDNIAAINPFNGERLPCIVSDHYCEKYGKTLAVVGIPQLNDVDRRIAEMCSDGSIENDTEIDELNGEERLYSKVTAQGEAVRKLKAVKADKFMIKQAVEELLNLKAEFKQFTGMDYKPGKDTRTLEMLTGSQSNKLTSVIDEANAVDRIKSIGCGSGQKTSSCLRDWLISRQRRWGTPIPIVHCPIHGEVPVPYDQLPVKLAKPNESLDDWKTTTCPICGSPSERETDTMDTFVDSSWYFLRYPDPHNEHEVFSTTLCNEMMPVDLYIGGKEHAHLHLYYARFIMQFLADQGLVKYREPFKRLLAQGIIKGKTYTALHSGKYLRQDEIVEKGDKFFVSSTNEEVLESFEKMSKSKFNGINPQDFVEKWGVTMARLYVLYAAAPHEDILWDNKTDIITGLMRWQMKLWRSVGLLIEARSNTNENDAVLPSSAYDTELRLSEDTNFCINQVTNLFESSCTISAGITSLMTLARQTKKYSSHLANTSAEFERSICAQVIMSSPMMPQFASELWEGLRGMKYKLSEQNWDGIVLDQPWPKPLDLEGKLHKKFTVRVDFKHCAVIRLPPHIASDLEATKEAVLSDKSVLKRIGNFQIDKIFEDKNMENRINIMTSKIRKNAT